jgi:hypothetical protein
MNRALPERREERRLAEESNTKTTFFLPPTLPLA